jgi:hypothetical protein
LIKRTALRSTAPPRVATLPRKVNDDVFQQGDQIGRIFPCREIFYFGSCMRSTKVAQSFWVTLHHCNSLVAILTKKLLWQPTFWAIFSQTRLVALFSSQVFQVGLRWEKCRACQIR